MFPEDVGQVGSIRRISDRPKLLYELLRLKNSSASILSGLQTGESLTVTQADIKISRPNLFA